jgi:hypothetical protein
MLGVGLLNGPLLTTCLMLFFSQIIFVSDFVVYLNFEIEVHLHALVPRTFYKLLHGKAVTVVVDHRYLLL